LVEESLSAIEEYRKSKKNNLENVFSSTFNYF